eukprot:scaffold2724_cov260-Pinguiococcus_pyrenoidosus.AAC.20
MDLKADQRVDLVPMPLLHTLAAKIADDWQHWRERVDSGLELRHLGVLGKALGRLGDDAVVAGHFLLELIGVHLAQGRRQPRVARERPVLHGRPERRLEREVALHFLKGLILVGFDAKGSLVLRQLLRMLLVREQLFLAFGQEGQDVLSRGAGRRDARIVEVLSKLRDALFQSRHLFLDLLPEAPGVLFLSPLCLLNAVL